jgi:hypothetical protein
MPDPYNIPITIANVLIELTSPLSAAKLGIQKRLGPFIGAPENPLARVALRWEESAKPPTVVGDLIYDPGLIWKMYRAGMDYCALFSYNSNNPQGILRANPAWSDLTLVEQRTGEEWQSLLSIGAGELILRTAILFTEGLVFHASGVDDNGKGIVFIGHSSAGKSTQAGLWRQATGVIAMNDDRIAVRVEDHGPMCYGTPWGGTADIARNHSAPLTALIVLDQARQNAIQPISPAEAAPLLTARAFLPYWDISLMSLSLTNLSTILRSVPVFLLRCRPDLSVIPLVRSVL